MALGPTPVPVEAPPAQQLALTKLDVLSAFDTIKVCVAYECDGVRYDYFPMQQSVLHHAKPIYVELHVEQRALSAFEKNGLPIAQRLVQHMGRLAHIGSQNARIGQVLVADLLHRVGVQTVDLLQLPHGAEVPRERRHRSGCGGRRASVRRRP